MRGKKVPVYEDSSIIEEAVIVEATPKWSLMQTVGTGKTPEKYWPGLHLVGVTPLTHLIA